MTVRIASPVFVGRGEELRRLQAVLEGAGSGVVDVALGRDNFRLEEVVISGQATGMEKKNLATAVGTVDADQLAAVPAASSYTPATRLLDATPTALASRR